MVEFCVISVKHVPCFLLIITIAECFVQQNVGKINDPRRMESLFSVIKHAR